MKRMARFYGHTPDSNARKAVELFETTAMTRSAGGMLLGTVYVDIMDEEWAVAFAYGRMRHPNLRGPEPEYEVRYSLKKRMGEVRCLDTRAGDAIAIGAGPFATPDGFILWAIGQERLRLEGTERTVSPVPAARPQ